MAKCLRCGAGAEWIQGNVPDEVPVEESADRASAAYEIERANRVYGRGAHTLMALMQAYERRVRSDCTTPEQIAAKPWECAEYRAAADFLRNTWPRATDPTPSPQPTVAPCKRCGGSGFVYDERCITERSTCPVCTTSPTLGMPCICENGCGLKRGEKGAFGFYCKEGNTDGAA